MEVIFLQSEKAQYSIHPKDAGKLIDVKLVQPEKAEALIISTLVLDKLMLPKLEQP